MACARRLIIATLCQRTHPHAPARTPTRTHAHARARPHSHAHARTQRANQRDVTEEIEEERAKVEARTPLTQAVFAVWRAKKVRAR